MRAIILGATVLLFPSIASAADAPVGWGGEIHVRSIGSDRIAVLVPEEGRLRVLLFQARADQVLDFIAPQTIPASVTLNDNRLTLTSSTLNLNLFVPTGGVPDSEATNGFALGSYYFPANVAIGNIAWEHLTFRMANAVSPTDVTCRLRKAVGDTDCTFGGPGAIVGPSFTCGTTTAGNMALEFKSNPGSSGPLSCEDGFYPCGTCNLMGQASNYCKYDTCQDYRDLKPPAPALPDPPK